MTPFIVVGGYWHFSGTCCLIFQGRETGGRSFLQNCSKPPMRLHGVKSRLEFNYHHREKLTLHIGK